jgi:amino acid transporter
MQEIEVKDAEKDGGFIRILGRRDVLALSFGAMIGWSWVLMSGTWVAFAGSFGAAIAMLIGGGIIGLISLTYAELASAMPNVGGEHVYTKRALGKNWSFICTWALLFSYVGICAFEAIALPTAIEYLIPDIRIGALWSVFGADVDKGFILIGILGSLLITWVNYRGIKTAALFQTVTVGMIAFAGILLISGAISFGTLDYAEPWIATPATGILSVLIMVPGLMVGFDVIPQSADEINLPKKQIGKLVVFSVGMVVLWYVAIALSVSMAMPIEDLKASPMATGDAASALWGSPLAGQMLVLGGVAGILTSWNAFVVAASRVMYALAKSGQIPAIFANLHPKYRTPYVGILFLGLVSVLAPFMGRTVLIWIVDATSFTVVIAFFFVALSFIVLRRKEPDMERPFKVKYGNFVGYASVILSLALLSIYMPWSPSALIWPYEWLMILIWAVLGVVVFYTCKEKT